MDGIFVYYILISYHDIEIVLTKALLQIFCHQCVITFVYVWILKLIVGMTIIELEWVVGGHYLESRPNSHGRRVVLAVTSDLFGLYRQGEVS